MRTFQIDRDVDVKPLIDEIERSSWDLRPIPTYSFNFDYDGLSLVGESSDPGNASHVRGRWEPVLTDAASDFPMCLAAADVIPGRNQRVAVRRIKAGKIFPKHVDRAPRSWVRKRAVRFHIPIVTDPSCVLMVWDHQGVPHEIAQPAGTVWFLDAAMTHMAVNGWTQSRYHLVVDKFLDEIRDWLADWMERWGIPLEP